MLEASFLALTMRKLSYAVRPVFTFRMSNNVQLKRHVSAGEMCYMLVEFLSLYIWYKRKGNLETNILPNKQKSCFRSAPWKRVT